MIVKDAVGFSAVFLETNNDIYFIDNRLYYLLIQYVVLMHYFLNLLECA